MKTDDSLNQVLSVRTFVQCKPIFNSIVMSMLIIVQIPVFDQNWILSGK